MFSVGPVYFRSFEAAVIVTLLVSVALLFVGHRSRWLVWWSVIAIVTLLLHLYIEDGRWQLVPTYILSFLFAIALARPSRRRFATPGFLIRIAVIVVLVAPSLLVVFGAPLFALPSPSGGYPVGTATVWFDAAADASHRLRVWYPAASGGARTVDGAREGAFVAPYWSMADYRTSSIPGVPRLLATHLMLVPTNSFIRAPVGAGLMPVLVAVRGDRVVPGDYLHLFEQAASLGWMVVEAPSRASDADIIVLLDAFAGEAVDSAFEGRIDSRRSVLLVLGHAPSSELGLAEIRVGGDPILGAILPGSRLSVRFPGYAVPEAASTLRHRMAIPSRLVVGGSDVPGQELERITLSFLSALLESSEDADPAVITGRRPASDALTGAHPNAVVTIEQDRR